MVRGLPIYVKCLPSCPELSGFHRRSADVLVEPAKIDVQSSYAEHYGLGGEILRPWQAGED